MTWPLYIIATAAGIGIGMWACDAAHADGLQQVYGSDNPCHAPLLDRRAYGETVMGEYEEAFYRFYRIRRLELCNDPLTATGAYYPAVPSRYLPQRPKIGPVRELPHDWPFPVCTVLCSGGGSSNPHPPVVVPEPPPSPVPLPASAWLIIIALALLAAPAIAMRKRK